MQLCCHKTGLRQNVNAGRSARCHLLPGRQIQNENQTQKLSETNQSGANKGNTGQKFQGQTKVLNKPCSKIPTIAWLMASKQHKCFAKWLGKTGIKKKLINQLNSKNYNKTLKGRRLRMMKGVVDERVENQYMIFICMSYGLMQAGPKIFKFVASVCLSVSY